MKLRWDKWSKYKVMKRSAALDSSLPRTLKLSPQTLAAQLNRYKTVIVKPAAKSGGIGVFQIAAVSGGKYKVRWEKRSRMVSGVNGAMSLLRSQSPGDGLVQRYIPLATVDGKPFDIRVMVQRGGDSDWKVTGKLAKVAGPGYLVTNTARSRGYVIPLSSAIHKSPGLSGKEGAILRQVNKLALHSAKQLHLHYPYIRTIGLDVGLDRSGKAWIIEANFAPSLSLFAKLKDKSMYHKIIRTVRIRAIELDDDYSLEFDEEPFDQL